jgi:hypothetical protein
MRSPSLTAAAARAVAGPPLSATLSQRPAQTPPLLPWHVAGTCDARTRMREMVRGQGVTHTQ